MWLLPTQYKCIYKPSGPGITGDYSIFQHKHFKKGISHGQKFRDPQNTN